MSYAGQVSKGRYVTCSGIKAVVAKLKSIALEWKWCGAIEDPTTGCLVITQWHANGESVVAPELNLERRIETDDSSRSP